MLIQFALLIVLLLCTVIHSFRIHLFKCSNQRFIYTTSLLSRNNEFRNSRNVVIYSSVPENDGDSNVTTENITDNEETLEIDELSDKETLNLEELQLLLNETISDMNSTVVIDPLEAAIKLREAELEKEFEVLQNIARNERLQVARVR